MNSNKPDPLDDMKQLWQQHLDRKTEEATVFQSNNLTTIMHKQSTIIQRLKRKLLIEMIATLPFVGLIYFLFDLRGFHLSVWFWIVLLTATFGYHIYLYLKLDNAEKKPDMPLLPTLQANIKRLKGLLVLYQAASVLMGLTFLFTSSLFTYFYARADMIQWVGLSIINVFGAIGGYVSGMWYANKLYRKPYEALLECERALRP